MTALASPYAFAADEMNQRTRQRIRWRDPVLFAKEALGYTLWPEQEEILRAMQAAPPHWFLEAPPGSGKTFLLRIDRLHHICYHPLERGIWTSATLPNARDSVRWLREQFEENEKIKEVFGHQPDEPWTDTAFQLKRPPNLPIKEPTVRGAGRGASIEGWRADWIAPDDIIDQDAMYSEADREESRRWGDSTLLRRLEPTGQMRGTANAWAMDDVYELWVNQRGISRLQVPVEKPDGTPNFPSRYPADFLANLRATDPFTWELRYMLNRTAQRGGWDWDWVASKMFDGTIANLRYSIGVDPALSPKGDYFALAVVGTAADGRMYLVDLYLGHLTAPAQVDLVIRKWKEWGAVSVGIEEVAYQGALKQHVQAAAPACPCVGVPLPQTAKEVKLQALAPLFSEGRLMVKRTLPELGAFRTQYLSFPRGQHDDALDALWIAVQGASRGPGGVIDVAVDWRM